MNKLFMTMALAIGILLSSEAQIISSRAARRAQITSSDDRVTLSDDDASIISSNDQIRSSKNKIINQKIERTISSSREIFKHINFGVKTGFMLSKYYIYKDPNTKDNSIKEAISKESEVKYGGSANSPKTLNKPYSSDFFLGAYTRYNLDDDISVQPEVSFYIHEIDNKSIKDILNDIYFDIPLIFRYRLEDSFVLELGPQIGFNLRRFNKEKTSDEKTSDGKTSDGKTSDEKTSDGKTSDEKTSDGKTSDGKIKTDKIDFNIAIGGTYDIGQFFNISNLGISARCAIRLINANNVKFDDIGNFLSKSWTLNIGLAYGF